MKKDKPTSGEKSNTTKGTAATSTTRTGGSKQTLPKTGSVKKAGAKKKTAKKKVSKKAAAKKVAKKKTTKPKNSNPEGLKSTRTTIEAAHTPPTSKTKSTHEPHEPKTETTTAPTTMSEPITPKPTTPWIIKLHDNNSGWLKPDQLDGLLAWLSGREEAKPHEIALKCLLDELGCVADQPTLGESVFKQLDRLLFVRGVLDLESAHVTASVDQAERRLRYRRLMAAFHPDRFPESLAPFLNDRAQAVVAAYQRFRKGDDEGSALPAFHEGLGDLVSSTYRGRSSASIASEDDSSGAMRVWLDRVRWHLSQVENLHIKLPIALAIFVLAPLLVLALTTQPPSPPHIAFDDPMANTTVGSMAVESIEKTRTWTPPPSSDQIVRSQAVLAEQQAQARQRIADVKRESQLAIDNEPTDLSPTRFDPNPETIGRALLAETQTPTAARAPASSVVVSEPTNTEPVMSEPVTSDPIVAMADGETVKTQALVAQAQPAVSDPVIEPTPVSVATIAVNPDPEPLAEESAPAVVMASAATERSQAPMAEVEAPEVEAPEVEVAEVEVAEVEVAEVEVAEVEVARSMPVETIDSPVRSSASQATTPTGTETADPRAMIRGMLDQFAQAFEAGDVQGMARYLSPAARYNNTSGIDGFKAHYTGLLEASTRRAMTINVVRVMPRGQGWDVLGLLNMAIDYPDRPLKRQESMARLRIEAHPIASGTSAEPWRIVSMSY